MYIVALWLILEASLVICRNWCVWCGLPPKYTIQNPVYVNCGPVVDLKSLTGHVLKLVCLVGPAPKCPSKKSSICKLWPCGWSWKPHWSCAKTGVFGVARPKMPKSKVQNMLIVALWLILEAPLVIYQNWCVCCGRPLNAPTKNPVYVKCGPVVELGSPTGHVQKLVCLVWPAPKCPIKKSSICKLWPCGWSWKPH